MERRIYLRQEEIKLGCGSTAREVTVENYYQVVEVDEDHVKIHLLDINDQPIGKALVITIEELKGYICCPDYFKNKKNPIELMVEKHVQSGDRHFGKKEYRNAEGQYNRALSLNGNHLRANLGKGKTLFARGRKAEARKIFSKLSNLDALFEEGNKHVFNEFGIELRKKGMFEEAISNYLKAISIDPNDEVLYYNLGRAYYEQGNYGKAIDELKSALAIRSDFKEAQEFLSKIQPR
jgi:tetratricopeptide (TPR) repeat protein